MTDDQKRTLSIVGAAVLLWAAFTLFHLGYTALRAWDMPTVAAVALGASCCFANSVIFFLYAREW